MSFPHTVGGDGRFPVLLQRTPYDRRDPVTGLLLASHGYVVVLQDTRGRFESGGEFYPFRHEAARPGIGCACICRAATSRASTATSTRATPSPPRRAW